MAYWPCHVCITQWPTSQSQVFTSEHSKVKLARAWLHYLVVRSSRRCRLHVCHYLLSTQTRVNIPRLYLPRAWLSLLQVNSRLLLCRSSPRRLGGTSETNYTISPALDQRGFLVSSHQLLPSAVLLSWMHKQLFLVFLFLVYLISFNYNLFVFIFKISDLSVKTMLFEFSVSDHQKL